MLKSSWLTKVNQFPDESAREGLTDKLSLWEQGV
jgi:hypothetical protein